MFKKVLTSFIVILFVLVFAGIGCKDDSSDQDQPETPTSALLTEAPESFDESFNQFKNKADELAANFRSDARLYYVRVKIDTSLNIEDNQYTFVYDYPTNTAYHYTITFEDNTDNYIRSLINKNDFLGSGIKQILPLYWKVNYVTALQAAESSIGESFRNEHVGNYKIELNLFRTGEETLKWQCEYSTLDEATTQRVDINAETGEIIS